MYAVSNPRNLARILSLGALGSRALYGDKYAADATELAAGRLPLWRRPPDATVLAQIADPASLVLIELDDLIDFEDITVIDGAIPIDHIRGVHFPSEEMLEEFLSTPFDNVDPRALRSLVSPNLLEAPPGSTERESVPQPSLLGDDTQEPQRRSLIEVASRLTPQSVDRLDRLVGAAIEMCLPSAATQSGLRMAAGALSKTLEGASPASELAAEVGGPESAEAIDTVAEALLSIPHGQRPTRSLLDQLADEAQKTWHHELDRAVRVLRSREVFGAVADWRDPISCGLVLALLRQVPEPIRDEFVAAPDESQPVVHLALWFAGLLRGAARRPVSSRVPELERVARSGLARLMNAPHDSAPEIHVPLPVEHTVERTDDGWSYRLVFGAQELEVGRRGVPSPADRLREAVDAGMDVEVAGALNVPTIVRVRADAPVSISSTFDDGALEMTITGEVEVFRSVDEAVIEKALASLDLRSASAVADRVLGTEVAP